MSVEQKKLTDKTAMSTTATTASSNSNINKPNNNNTKKNNSTKKLIKKALKTSKTKKPNKTTIAAAIVNSSSSNNNTHNVNKTENIKENNENNISKNVETACSGDSCSNKNNNNTGDSNIKVGNDEIIEELFDFSDSDLKELDISNERNNENSDIKEECDTKVELQKIQIDNNNNKENDKKQQQEKQQVIKENVLSSPTADNTDRQIEKEEIVVLDTVTKLSISNVMPKSSIPMNNDNNDNNEAIKEIEQNHEENESNNIHTIPVTLANSCSIVKEYEKNDKTLPTVSTSPPSASSPLDKESRQKITDTSTTEFINVNKITTTASSTTNDSNNDDDLIENNDVDDDDEEYIEPYDELLVQFLDEANQIAEARLAARRHARAEAREIRMRELERQQKEQESNADRVFDMHTNTIGTTSLSHMRLGLGSSPVTGLLNSTRGNSMSSRRSSEDSLEEEGRSLRDIRHELKDVEERFRKAMIANAQLDNDRASQTYQIQLLKDKLEDMEESYAQLQRECKEKTRECNAFKRSLDKLSEELKLVQGQLNERDTLITEQGLVIVAIENEDGTDAKRALVSVENAQLLGSVQGSLDVRLKKFSEEKQQLQAEVQQLQEQLETYKSQGKGRGKGGSSSNGPIGSDDDDYEAQREANKIISDYKYKLQKAEQEIASLQSSLARSETQVIRYKSTAEAAEKAEAELKIERRKLQRENREAMEKLEELETSNNHLLKRLDKLKNAKSALLKDL